MQEIHQLTLAVKSNDDWITLLANQLPLPRRRYQNTSSADLQGYSFGRRRICYLTPFLNLTDKPMLTYLDTHLDHQASWKNVQAIGFNSKGFVIDVTGFTLSTYPISKINKQTFSAPYPHFMVNRDAYYQTAMVYPGRPETDVEKHIQQDIWQTRYGHWDKSAEIDPILEQTDYQTSKHGQITKITTPAIQFMDDSGKVVTGRLVIRHGYNNMRKNIGHADGKGNVTAFILDEAGHKMKHVLGDGTLALWHVYNALSQVPRYLTPLGLWVYQTYFRDDTLSSVLRPSHPTAANLRLPPNAISATLTQFEVNELRKRSGIHRPAGTATAAIDIYENFDFDPKENVYASYNGRRLATTYVRHRSGEIYMQTNPDGSRLTYNRNYKGTLQTFRDLGGALYTYLYDGLMQLASRQSQGGRHGSELVIVVQTTQNGRNLYIPVVVPTPGQHQEYKYVAKRLMQVIDYALKQVTENTYDQNRRRIKLQVNDLMSNAPIRTVHANLNALGWEESLFDSGLTFAMWHDAAANVRYRAATLKDGANRVIAVRAGFNFYDRANRDIRDFTVDNAGTLKPAQGLLTTYDVNTKLARVQQSIAVLPRPFGQTTSTQVATAILNRYPDGLLATMTIKQADGLFNYYLSTLNYDLMDRLLQSVRNVYDGELEAFGIEITEGTAYNNDSAVARSHTLKKFIMVFPIENQISDTSYALNLLDLPTSSVSQFSGQSQTSLDLQQTYVAFAEYLLSQVSGTSHDKSGAKQLVPATRYYNANGIVSGELGVVDQNNKPITMISFLSTANGLILEKRVFRPNGVLGVILQLAPTYNIDVHRLFYGMQGEPLCSYQTSTGSIFANILRHATNIFGGHAITIRGKFDILDPLKLQYSLSPTPTPKKIMAKAGDTFEKLALAIWQNASYATLLAEYNNWPVNEPLDTDKVIKVPQFVALYKDKLGSEEFNEFMAKFVGALEPHVKWKQPPKHHHGFLSMVVETIVVVAAAVIAPHLIAAVLPALVGTLTGDMLAGVAGALIDTVGQEAAKGIGLIKHINWTDVVTAAVTGGMGTKLSVLDKALGKGIANTIVTQGIENTVIQLDDLALGLSKQFDFRAVFMSMLQAGIDAKIDLTLHLNDPFSTELANSIAGIGISEATTGHVDLQALAANMIGDIIGEEAGTGIDSALGRNQAGQSYDRAHQNAKGKTTTPRYRNHVRHETETAMRQRNGGSQSSGSSQRNGSSQHNGSSQYNNGSQNTTANNTHNHSNRAQQPQHRDINHTHPHSFIDELKEMTNIHPKDAWHYWDQYVEDQNHAAPHTTQQIAANQNPHGASATNAANAGNKENATNNNGPSIQWANNSDEAQVNNYYSRASQQSSNRASFFSRAERTAGRAIRATESFTAAAVKQFGVDALHDVENVVENASQQHVINSTIDLAMEATYATMVGPKAYAETKLQQIGTGIDRAVHNFTNEITSGNPAIMGRAVGGALEKIGFFLVASKGFGGGEAESVIYGARGSTSGRLFDETAAGGPIRDLAGSQAKIKFTHQGIDIVEKHISRFGPDAANQYMVSRLRSIASGEITATQVDRNFYSHELREFVRYRRLGWENGTPANYNAAQELWNNTHTATLEEYGLSGADKELYHAEALELATRQIEQEFLNTLKFNPKL